MDWNYYYLCHVRTAERRETVSNCQGEPHNHLEEKALHLDGKIEVWGIA